LLFIGTPVFEMTGDGRFPQLSRDRSGFTESGLMARSAQRFEVREKLDTGMTTVTDMRPFPPTW
jgi:hypothetical protein